MDEVPDLFATVSSAAEQDRARRRSPGFRAMRRRFERTQAVLGAIAVVAASIGSVLLGWLIIAIGNTPLGVLGIAIGVCATATSWARWLGPWRSRPRRQGVQQLAASLAVGYAMLAPFYLLLSFMFAMWR